MNRRQLARKLGLSLLSLGAIARGQMLAQRPDGSSYDLGVEREAIWKTTVLRVENLRPLGIVHDAKGIELGQQFEMDMVFATKVPNDTGSVREVAISNRKYNLLVAPVDGVRIGEQTSRLILSYVQEKSPRDQAREGYSPASTEQLKEAFTGQNVSIRLDHYKP